MARSAVSAAYLTTGSLPTPDSGVGKSRQRVVSAPAASAAVPVTRHHHVARRGSAVRSSSFMVSPQDSPAGGAARCLPPANCLSPVFDPATGYALNPPASRRWQMREQAMLVKARKWSALRS
ncbi:hypothetical protein GCM10010391_71810 [Streptomyces anthocyanicus]|nr:hypothetical protein GCM10010391_71810 [Streptomyces anthocyanicus]